ncbi:hypothetical protein D3C84_652510 [compost metagenome]
MALGSSSTQGIVGGLGGSTTGVGSGSGSGVGSGARRLLALLSGEANKSGAAIAAAVNFRNARRPSRLSGICPSVPGSGSQPPCLMETFQAPAPSVLTFSKNWDVMALPSQCSYCPTAAQPLYPAWPRLLRVLLVAGAHFPAELHSRISDLR